MLLTIVSFEKFIDNNKGIYYFTTLIYFLRFYNCVNIFLHVIYIWFYI